MKNILEAMRDPQLFESTFKRRLLRGDSWKAWRAFLAGLFGLAMDEEARGIFQAHTGRSDSPTQQASEAFVICGRRSGKSVIAALIAVFICCFRDYSKILVPGESAIFMVLASDRRQARVIFNYITAFLQSPALKGMLVEVLKESVILSNGLVIEIHTSNFRAVRGPTIVGAVCDEISFWPTDDSASPDSETLNALRPAMATVPGALLLAISSPYAKRGALYEVFREHYGKASEVLIWKSDSQSMNPTLSRAVIAAAYLRDAASARAEYGGEFRSDVESFLDIEIVEARTIAGRFELSPHGKNYVAFCDPSGGRSDSFTLAIAHDQAGMAVLDCLREIPAPFSPESACDEFVPLLKSYGLSEVTGDKYAGEWPREQFRKRGITYRVADKTRSELYLELLPGLMSGRVELLDNKRLLTQLVSLERRTTRSGRDSVDHAPGSKDDLANSAAGALVRALGGGGLRLTYAEMVLELEAKYGAAWPEHIGDSAVVETRRPLPGPTEVMKNGKPCCPQPECGSTLIVRRGPLHLCNRCGFEFAVAGARGVPFSLDGPPKGQRRDALAKGWRR